MWPNSSGLIQSVVADEDGFAYSWSPSVVAQNNYHWLRLHQASFTLVMIAEFLVKEQPISSHPGEDTISRRPSPCKTVL